MIKITRHFCVNSYSKNPLSFSLIGMRMKMRTSDGDYENADYVPSKNPLSFSLVGMRMKMILLFALYYQNTKVVFVAFKSIAFECSPE